jgi:ABC-2 type transport system permease protein
MSVRTVPPPSPGGFAATLAASTRITGMLFRRALTSRWVWLLGVLDGLIILGVQYALWRALLPLGRPTPTDLPPVTADLMVSYALLALAIGTVTRGRIARDIEDRLRKGVIVYDLLRPTGLPIIVMSRSFGLALADLLLQIVPVAILASFAWSLSAPASPGAVVLALLCLVVGVAIAYAIDFALGVLGFRVWTTEHFEWVVHMIRAVLSGAIVPFWFLPETVQVIAGALPFHMLGYTPIAIYLGRIEAGQAALLIMTGALWAVVLTVGAALMWRHALRQLTIQGG